MTAGVATLSDWLASLRDAELKTIFSRGIAAINHLASSWDGVAILNPAMKREERGHPWPHPKLSAAKPR